MRIEKGDLGDDGFDLRSFLGLFVADFGVVVLHWSFGLTRTMLSVAEDI